MRQVVEEAGISKDQVRILAETAPKYGIMPVIVSVYPFLWLGEGHGF